MKDVVQEFSQLDDQMASNNWVIHGKHTANGLPLLANDPHLNTALPSFWQLQELVWEEKFMIGGSVPGIPMIAIGRSKNISWGQTAPLADSSDLWQEEISEDGKQYKLDGQWVDLKIEKHSIKVKGQDTVEFELSFTHRGPVMKSQLLYEAGVLFGGSLPAAKFEHSYSHAWGGMFAGESFFDLLQAIADGKGVKEVMEQVTQKGT